MSQVVDYFGPMLGRRRSCWADVGPLAAMFSRLLGTLHDGSLWWYCILLLCIVYSYFHVCFICSLTIILCVLKTVQPTPLVVEPGRYNYWCTYASLGLNGSNVSHESTNIYDVIKLFTSTIRSHAIFFGYIECMRISKCFVIPNPIQTRINPHNQDEFYFIYYDKVLQQPVSLCPFVDAVFLFYKV